jgi:DNA polymerase-3 subunit alpha
MAEPVPTAVQPPDWHQRLLADERDALGFYLTSHPLQLYANELSNQGLDTTQSIRKRFGPGGRDHHNLRPEREPASEDGRPNHRGKSPEARNRVSLAGIAVDIKVLRTRKGDRMAFITLEDFFGQLEATLFPEVYQQARALLEQETPLIATALVVGEGEELKLQLEELIDLTAFRLKANRAIRIETAPELLSPEILDRLADILTRHGNGPLIVEMVMKLPGARAIFRLGDPFRVVPSDALLAELTALFGHPARLVGQGELP